MDKSLGQLRADFALKKVEEIIKADSKYKNLNNKEFKSFVNGAPSMILQNGLGQALAFWCSKSKDGEETKYGYLLKVIREWFNEGVNPLKLKDNIENNKDFLKKLMNMEQKDYLAYQVETTALLEWFKRFVNAFVEDKENDNIEEE